MPKRGPYRKAVKAAPPRWRRNFVKEWRLFRKMTVEKLAEASGLSPGTVSAIENRQQGYSDESLESLSKALKTSRGALLDVNPNQPSSADFFALWDRADEPQRAQLAEIASTIVRPGKTGKL
jgi:transcriptional regulator with XRE-family HTH domain